MGRKNLIATTTGANPAPTCFLCEMEVPRTSRNGIAGSHHTAPLLKSKWRSYWRSRLKHVMVPSIEVEEAYFDNFPRIWSCLCRAIVKESDTKYRLTGINMIQEEACDPYFFPKDPASARIGGRPNARYDTENFTRLFAAKMGRQPPQYKGELLGYIVHAHCWVLFARVLGAIPTQTQLPKIIQAARNHWRIHKLRPLEDYNARWVQPTQALSEFDHDCDIYQNPLIIPALQEVFTHTSTAQFPYPPPCSSTLSIEVAVLISEWVCPAVYTVVDVQNMRNMLLVFQWQLPDWFWRRRLKEEMFFELDAFRKSHSSVDWQTLRLDLMGLVADRTWYTTKGLANRERMLGNIVAIQKASGMI